MQLYPESAEQLELITTIALRCGFSGGLVVDYPNSRKARKHYLCLFAGLDAAKVPEGERRQAPLTSLSSTTLARPSRHNHARVCVIVCVCVCV
jgi:18S rRNA (guanine1575-N7)-methyltransferase